MNCQKLVLSSTPLVQKYYSPYSSSLSATMRFIFLSAVSFLVIPFAEVELCQPVALGLAMRL